MTTTLAKQWQTTVSALPGTRDEAEMLISNPTVDRDRDRVMPQGVDLTNAKRNLPLLWGHDYKSLPVGTVTAVDIARDGLRARWRWLKDDPFADRVKNAWEQGIVRAASIGFKPRKSVPNEFGGYDHLEWELLEVSLCPIGANPAAVRLLKGLGLADSLSDRISAQITQDLLDHWCRVLTGGGPVLDLDDDAIDFPVRTIDHQVREVLAAELAAFIADEVQACVFRKMGKVVERDCVDVVW